MEEYVKIIEDFYKLHKFGTITDDVIFVNGNVFMITSERNIKFATVEHIPIQTTDNISKSLNIVVKLYGQGGFIIRVILTDMEF